MISGLDVPAEVHIFTAKLKLMYHHSSIDNRACKQYLTELTLSQINGFTGDGCHHVSQSHMDACVAPLRAGETALGR